MIKVFPCGSLVVTRLSKIEGIITAVSIRFSAIAYEVSYFKDQEQKQCWLNECEFDLETKDKVNIGFRK